MEEVRSVESMMELVGDRKGSFKPQLSEPHLDIGPVGVAGAVA